MNLSFHEAKIELREFSYKRLIVKIIHAIV
jgi:hypothetical protein